MSHKLGGHPRPVASVVHVYGGREEAVGLVMSDAEDLCDYRSTESPTTEARTTPGMLVLELLQARSILFSYKPLLFGYWLCSTDDKCDYGG